LNISFLSHIPDIRTINLLPIMVNVKTAAKSLWENLVDSLRMKPIQYMVWMLGWSIWTLGSLQYYSLPFTLSSVATYLDVKQTKISEANTTTMIARLLGALIFGVISDQYGRKIPLMIVLVLEGVFTLGTGFIKTYGQLIGLRLMFGMVS
jgi:SHS family lactate transporter-like MFS transporter